MSPEASTFGLAVLSQVVTSVLVVDSELVDELQSELGGFSGVKVFECQFVERLVSVLSGVSWLLVGSKQVRDSVQLREVQVGLSCVYSSSMAQHEGSVNALVPVCSVSQHATLSTKQQLVVTLGWQSLDSGSLAFCFQLLDELLELLL